MQIKVYLRDGKTLVAGDVESIDTDFEGGYTFFVVFDTDGDKLLVVNLNELVAVEFIHE